MTQGTLQRWMIANPLKTFNTQKLGISGDTTISDLVVTPRQATIFKGLTIWFIEDAGVKTKKWPADWQSKTVTELSQFLIPA